MARPRLTTPVRQVKLTLSLREDEDDDLIAWFDSLPTRQRARAVLAALRQGGAALVADELAADEDELAGALVDMLF